MFRLLATNFEALTDGM